MAVPDFARNITAPFTPCVSHGPIQRTLPGMQSAAKDAGASAQKNVQAANVPAANTPASATKADKTASAQNAGSSAFDDLLDIVNPLQHIPIISTIYRAITGDKIGDAEKIAGGALYGGLIGLGSSLADVAFTHLTGKDFSATMLAMIDGGNEGGNSKPVAIASAQTAPRSVTVTPVQTPQHQLSLAQIPQGLFPQANIAAVSATPKSVIPAQAIAPNFNAAALSAAMQRNGVDSSLGLRALAAYQQSLSMTPDQIRKAATGL